MLAAPAGPPLVASRLPTECLQAPGSARESNAESDRSLPRWRYKYNTRRPQRGIVGCRPGLPPSSCRATRSMLRQHRLRQDEARFHFGGGWEDWNLLSPAPGGSALESSRPGPVEHCTTPRAGERALGPAAGSLIGTARGWPRPRRVGRVGVRTVYLLGQHQPGQFCTASRPPQGLVVRSSRRSTKLSCRSGEPATIPCTRSSTCNVCSVERTT